MAGSLYLGSQRICPAVVSGGSEPTEYFTFKFPDNLTTFSSSVPYGLSIEDDSLGIICVDFNNVENLTNCNLYDFCSYIKNPLIIKGIENIKTISGTRGTTAMCRGCNFADGYRDIYFNNLESVSGGGFVFTFWSSNIKSVHFLKLKTISSEAFRYMGNKNGYDVYFNAVLPSSFSVGDELKNIAGECSNVILHFPSNLSDTIPNQNGYPDFGGTNTTILYDLEPTE